MTERRFGFVQWEFAGRLGPDPGRYPVRRFAGDDVRQIVVIGGYQAPRRTLLPRPRRAKAAKAPEPAAVDVTRATVIDAAPMYERDAAEAWLEQAAGARSDEVVADALAVLNRAVAAHRVSAADPLLADADPARALVVRVGYGLGEQVAEGALGVRPRAAEADAGAARARSCPSSGWPRCSAGATSRWRARSSPCGRAATSTPAASARPRCSCTSRSRPPSPSWRAGAGAPTSASGSTSWPGCARGSRARRTRRSRAGWSPDEVSVVSGALERLEAALRARAAREASSGS